MNLTLLLLSLAAVSFASAQVAVDAVKKDSVSVHIVWLGEDWDGGWHDGDAEMQQLLKIRVL